MVSFKRKAAAWSPVDVLIAGDEGESVPSRRGPSLMFAVAVIGGVTLLTGAAVATFFSQSAESAAEPAPRIVAEKQPAPEIASDEQPSPQLPADDKPVMTASLVPAFPPVRKVVTKSFPALKADQLPAPKPVAARAAVKPVAAAAAPKPETDSAKPKPSAEAVVASAGDVDALAEQDPRWARADVAAAHDTFLAVIPPATSSGDQSDDTETAAIEPDQAKPERVSAPADDKAQADDTPAPAVAGTRSVQVNKGVNMRSRGRSGSNVVMTIPRSATVQVVGCKAWCEVIYKGRRGFIYKSFVGGGGGSKRSASRSKQQPTVAAAPKDDAKTVYVVDSAGQTDSPETTGSTTTATTSEQPATPRFTVEHDR
jgi:uncharacterized protein YraI